MSAERMVSIGKEYRHFKGGHYRVLHVARHSETMEEYVVYQALYGEYGIWVRPLDMFLSMKEDNGTWVERFAELP